MKQPTYRSLMFEHAELDKAHTKLQSDFTQLQREHAAIRESCQTAASQSETAAQAARQVGHLAPDIVFSSRAVVRVIDWSGLRSIAYM